MGVFILVELFFKKVISFKHTHNLNLERLSIHQGTTFSSLNGDIMGILQLLANFNNDLLQVNCHLGFIVILPC
jgi:hypothetical protein